MSSPYTGRAPRSFWRTGVADQHPITIEDLYVKKFAITAVDRIATAGSCFAQHIAIHLRRNGYTVIDAEPAPPGLDEEAARDFGFGIFSARYGNIYCVRQLLQLAREVYGEFSPQDIVWEKQGRFYDALRPSVEPQGHATPELVHLHRRFHLDRVRHVFETCSVFVFTFGLTEAWLHGPSGTVYPTAPGTIAGTWNPDLHVFTNFTFAEIHADFLAFRDLIRARNPAVKFLLTVSPVPLTATAGSDHVLCATTYSKSVLRAVAGELCMDHPDIDYFPSYEMIATPFSRGFFFESNLRSVNSGGVAQVMRVFFSQHGAAAEESRTGPGSVRSHPRRGSPGMPNRRRSREEVVCDDALLEAFAE
jgi:hypothetical protein